ncbi:MAG: radical SAM/SPASM domain-containing protein [Candidatus Omnitrophota bacterium]|jgi:radical SAM protein with 4Fe4S-binding SPASM domain|nr:MAG: radical SAM/SPASM domain-containing protein [Candidatus Omnitrophota bacterium]
MKKSETLTQFSCESFSEYIRNEYRRARGKMVSYLLNRYQWKYYPVKKVPSFPLNVDIEVSSKCQLKCTHCFRQYMDMGEDHYMPLNMYTKIVKECGDHRLFTLKFSMRGEPLMHPDIVEMVRLAKEAGIREVWINTNGGMITEKLARGLITAGVDWITVSFDGLGEIYEKIRTPLKYEQSLEKLKTLRRIRDELKGKTLLNVQTLWSAIKEDPDAYVNLMKGIVDRVAYNPDMNFEAAILVPDENFICPRLWQRIAITSRGNYLKCPSDFTMDEILGHVNQYSVKEAWDILQEEQRQLHLSGRRLESKVCEKCHHGARKVKKNVQIEGIVQDDFTYAFKEDFSGWGDRGETREKTELCGKR